MRKLIFAAIPGATCVRRDVTDVTGAIPRK